MPKLQNSNGIYERRNGFAYADRREKLAPSQVKQDADLSYEDDDPIKLNYDPAEILDTAKPLEENRAKSRAIQVCNKIDIDNMYLCGDSTTAFEMDKRDQYFSLAAVHNDWKANKKRSKKREKPMKEKKKFRLWT